MNTPKVPVHQLSAVRRSSTFNIWWLMNCVLLGVRQPSKTDGWWTTPVDQRGWWVGWSTPPFSSSEYLARRGVEGNKKHEGPDLIGCLGARSAWWRLWIWGQRSPWGWAHSYFFVKALDFERPKKKKKNWNQYWKGLESKDKTRKYLQKKFKPILRWSGCCCCCCCCSFAYCI